MGETEVGGVQERPVHREGGTDTPVEVVADHGMEENDPTCQGDWDVALRAAGVDARDEAYSFLYLGT